MEKETIKRIKRITITAVITLGIIALLYTYLISQPSVKTNQNPSLFEDCRFEQVPYQETEEYMETVPYQERIPFQFNAVDNTPFPCADFGNYKECYYVTVTNLDSIGGVFEVNCDFQTLNRRLSDSDSSYIKPGESFKFTCEADVDFGEDIKGSYFVSPPIKEETRYKDVQRTKTVTKYREEKFCY